ncbi:DUF4013 domain-containing protein [Methanobacterium ferruginis]|uniref:DUF4013 domain-containing protein n=1 Tax=Methanobacterium ferruginis TaxID=710191 RepID=UPI002573D3E0|nr:DUF4013 domain-containing protein [Methanobacterium ferruginis]MCC7549951.1 DUF4013 domain-containing protein [Methanobacterium sp.]BDZ67177.1 hypothetical protein GCM10025860_06250 [Methanobacterium ferruginis]
MNIKEIIIDSIKYPFLDWKKILILGLIVVIYKFPLNIISPFNLQNGFTYPFLVIALLINCFIIGYFFKIIQYSLKDTRELPRFRKWVNLFKNGFKVTCVSLIYSIPATLPLVILNSCLLNFYSYEPYFFGFIMDAIGHGYSYTFCFAYILYLLILFPISLIAIANMANNDGKWGYAFEFKVIFGKIKNIGWIKFYSWYLLTSVFDLLIFLIGSLITMLSILIPIFPFGLIDPLILIPYIYIFFSRSIALIYQSDNTI